METIEEIYAGMFEEHELVLAARRQERIKAANPYGCNQYGEGWKAPHNGKQSKAGEPAKKDSSEGEKKEPDKYKKKLEEFKKKLNHDIWFLAREAKAGRYVALYNDNGFLTTTRPNEEFSPLLTSDDLKSFIEENNLEDELNSRISERFIEEYAEKYFEIYAEIYDDL